MYELARTVRVSFIFENKLVLSLDQEEISNCSNNLKKKSSTVYVKFVVFPPCKRDANTIIGKTHFCNHFITEMSRSFRRCVLDNVKSLRRSRKYLLNASGTRMKDKCTVTSGVASSKGNISTFKAATYVSSSFNVPEILSISTRDSNDRRRTKSTKKRRDNL